MASDEPRVGPRSGLLPCPFCGGAAMVLRPDTRDMWEVRCAGCLVRTGCYREQYIPRDLWNRRTPTPAPDAKEG